MALRSSIKILVVLTFAVVLLGVETPQPFENVAPAFDINVSIAPSTQYGYPLTLKDPPTFTCSAEVLQPGTSRAYAVLQNVTVRRGSSERVEQHAAGLDITFDVSVNRVGDRAHSSVVIARSGIVLSRQRSTVWLQQPKRTAPSPQ